jgi:hypothetical protein
MKSEFFADQLTQFSKKILLEEGIQYLATSISFAYISEGFLKTKVSIFNESIDEPPIGVLQEVPDFDKLLTDYYQYLNELVDKISMVNVHIFISSTEFSARFMNHPILITKDNLRYLKDIGNTSCCIHVVRKLEQADFTITKE